MKTIEAVGKNICTGCGACYNVCSKDAISMVLDDEGFLFPVIDHEKCINCGICLKSCAAYHPCYENDKEPKCYAVWADDKIREMSASGGGFTLLANYVLEQDGYVCGAAWDANFNVEHVLINKFEELAKIQGVKYIQSTTGKTFSDIKAYLESNKPVLFVGTPCQVAGLKAFLKKDWDKLVTVDLVCHGAPSRGVWQKYVREIAGIAGHKQITQIRFRNKKYGWRPNLEISFSDGTVYRNTPPMDVFYEAFYILLNTRESCGSCPFAKVPRQGDLTIGDAWGCPASMNDRKGTSEILINNEKGERVFANIISTIKKYDVFDFNQAKTANKPLVRAFNSHPERKRFFRLWKKYPTKKAYNYAVKRKFDIGLLGIWFYQNYGSILTTYALGKFLTENGQELLLIDNAAMFNPAHPALNGILNPRRFLENYFDISRPYKSSEEMALLNKHVDTFITGSDQLFNWFLSVEIQGYTYYQDFVEDDKNRVAYATSFGAGYCYFKKEYEICKPLLQKFNAISVREDINIGLINDEFDINAVYSVDPVFLLPREEYETLAASSMQTYRDYMLAYILDMSTEKLRIVDEYASVLKKKVVIIPSPATRDHIRFKKFRTHHTVLEPDIIDWLYLFRNAEFIITDSYHGTLFSIIFKKDFVAIGNPLRSSVRFQSILNRLKVNTRLISDIPDVLPQVDDAINYEAVYKILERDVSYSSKWLLNAIDPTRRNINEIQRIEEKIENLDNQLRELRTIIEGNTKVCTPSSHQLSSRTSHL